MIGFIGLGDQGLPMAVAIATAGFQLHVWQRTPDALRVLDDVPHVAHATTRELGAACDIVGLCVSTDDDVMEILAGGLLDGLRRSSVVVNHGTGAPKNTRRLTELCAAAGEVTRKRDDLPHGKGAGWPTYLYRGREHIRSHRGAGKTQSGVRRYQRGDDGKWAAAGRSYFSYCGTFEVDEERYSVTHIVALELGPELDRPETGSPRRPFRRQA